MKVMVTTPREVNIKYLQVEAGVRYWEDATVNGVEDVDGTRIPCRKGDMWCPYILIDTGKISNWPQGVVADIHYKVCDAGSYWLFDENHEDVAAIEEDYVPKIMCPEEDGHGDYIIMKVNCDGFIENWKPTLDGFDI